MFDKEVYEAFVDRLRLSFVAKTELCVVGIKVQLRLLYITCLL